MYGWTGLWRSWTGDDTCRLDRPIGDRGLVLDWLVIVLYKHTALYLSNHVHFTIVRFLWGGMSGRWVHSRARLGRRGIGNADETRRADTA